MGRASRREAAEEGEIRNLSAFSREYATLPGTIIPVRVVTGDSVRVTTVQFQWKGPAKTVYFCWGLKQGTDFNNGAALEGGATKFASAAIAVAASLGVWSATKVYTIAATLLIDSSIRMGIVFDTWKWVAQSATANESQIYRIDVDAGTVQTFIEEAVQFLDCNYVKV